MTAGGDGDDAYHHRNLRATLLEAAERSLRENGAEQLSLRELAREAGVSHAAPRRHFADRQALLDALAESGFARLGAELRTARDAAGSVLLEKTYYSVGGGFVVDEDAVGADRIKLDDTRLRHPFR
ncbi:TetR family transcriptional regulator, partial [Vibrio vulnificus]|nr:TetR family transcriptional regulator [Vibrio vulnificus]